MEASGTSGMKAAMNGVLNCSIMDGWWDEAALENEGDFGWCIGRGEEYANPETADQLESQALYDLFEREIVPLFYDRDEQGVPRKWVAMMKQCIAKLAPVFNTNRMLQEYSEKLYLPALKRARVLAANDLKGSRELAHQKERLRRAWHDVRVESVSTSTDQPLGVRDMLNLSAVVSLGGLKPEEVRVQVYAGRLDNDGRLIHTQTIDMEHKEDLGGGRSRFVGAIETQTSGRHGFAVRVIPGGVMFEGIQEPGLMLWEREAAKPKAEEPAPQAAPAMAH
jgi:starch phosphorylase